MALCSQDFPGYTDLLSTAYSKALHRDSVACHLDEKDSDLLTTPNLPEEFLPALVICALCREQDFPLSLSFSTYKIRLIIYLFNQYIVNAVKQLKSNAKYLEQHDNIP